MRRMPDNLRKVGFHDDDDYRRFQLWWAALHRSELKLTVVGSTRLDRLRRALGSISQPTPQGGRVLIAEADIDVLEGDLSFSVEAVRATPWADAARPFVGDLIEWLAGWKQ